MGQYENLVFVDEDNTTRSVMAELIMQKQYLLTPLQIASRGLIVLFPEPINRKAEAVLISKGYPASGHTAVQLTQADITDRTLVITMEDSQKDRIRAEYDHAVHVFTLAEYCKYSQDVRPLFGEELQAYGKCCEFMEEMIGKLVIQLNEEELSE